MYSTAHIESMKTANEDSKWTREEKTKENMNVDTDNRLANVKTPDMVIFQIQPSDPSSMFSHLMDNFFLLLASHFIDFIPVTILSILVHVYPNTLDINSYRT